MGGRQAKLSNASLVASLSKETGFSEGQIQRFYCRFRTLDGDHKGYLSAFDLLRLPEFCVNPLAERIVLAMYREARVEDYPATGEERVGSEKIVLMEDIRISFECFVRAFARFRATDVRKEDDERYATVQGKMLFIFRMIDVHNDGVITMSEVFSLLKTLSPRVPDADLHRFAAEFFIEASKTGSIKETIAVEDFCSGNDRERLVEDLYFRFPQS